MTTLATRIKEVTALEGFNIAVFDGKGVPADPKTQGLPAYDYTNKAAKTMNVVTWKNRFTSNYPGYLCDVLNKDGTVAHGNAQLETVRATYE